jgi:hypothetical protein
MGILKDRRFGPLVVLVVVRFPSFSRYGTTKDRNAGVDMFIEFTDRTFSKKLTQIGCAGLDFSYENRSQFYDGPLETIDI